MRRVPVPDSARALCTLGRIDYEDAFVVDVSTPARRTAEQWMRATFDDAPEALRMALWSGWLMLGLKLGPPSSRARILGWEVECATEEAISLAAISRLGMSARLLLTRRADSLLLDTFVQLDTRFARALWAGVAPLHSVIVPSVLTVLRRRTHADRTS